MREIEHGTSFQVLPGGRARGQANLKVERCTTLVAASMALPIAFLRRFPGIWRLPLPDGRGCVRLISSHPVALLWALFVYSDRTGSMPCRPQILCAVGWR